MPLHTEKMLIAWNTLATQKFKKAYESLLRSGKEHTRKELGDSFQAKYNLIFIGRFLPDKGIDTILAVVGQLAEQLDIAFHFIGKGEVENLIRNHELFDKNIFLHGAIYDDEVSSKYLFASDLFIMSVGSA